MSSSIDDGWGGEIVDSSFIGGTSCNVLICVYVHNMSRFTFFLLGSVPLASASISSSQDQN